MWISCKIIIQHLLFAQYRHHETYVKTKYPLTKMTDKLRFINHNTKKMIHASTTKKKINDLGWYKRRLAELKAFRRQIPANQKWKKGKKKFIKANVERSLKPTSLEHFKIWNPTTMIFITYQYVPAPWDVSSIPWDPTSFSTILLRPKSVTLAIPSSSNKIFPGFKS